VVRARRDEGPSLRTFEGGKGGEMIKARKATKESRPRDRKRKRVILQVGRMKWHVEPEEAAMLVEHLNEALGKKMIRLVRGWTFEKHPFRMPAHVVRHNQLDLCACGITRRRACEKAGVCEIAMPECEDEKERTLKRLKFKSRKRDFERMDAEDEALRKNGGKWLKRCKPISIEIRKAR